ncbi:tripartite ATP-independent transporter DctP family solute receptor [Anoxybacillus vitaminiphilus]|uniref:Tripartite ATP-independent transporter DctP family solute receptor n=1 Tax=Paranoxybacillus vitaminiphilus TaxID=581036 RepID=A0A327YQP9_9BACL|nr:TRAP transporter substrate-binding protein [Anoxybacillus vitaminiphilus]RAK22025.1 tripartite ATP-independent transporter DctP family solute receptor [Anoxybacillus vitaminiphilus]
MKKLLILLLTCILALVGCSNGSSSGEKSNEAGTAKQKVMKLAVVTSKDRSLTKGLYKFGEIVEKETGGSIKVEVYPDGQLGGDLAVFEGLKMGSIQGTTMSTGPISSFAPRFAVLDLPFLFKDSETAYKVLDGDVGKELLNDLPSVGVIGLNYWENGFRHLTNNVREVKTVDDIKGLKIRTLENELHIDLWKELGATPVPMAYTELFTALEQRVVDGQENPVGNVKTGKFNEVQKYLTKTGHVYNASVFMISKKFWDTLSDKEKEIITKAAEEVKDYQRKLNQQEDVESFDYLEKQGMVITELTPEEKQKFVDKVQPIYEKYSSEFGKDLVNQLLEAGK